MRRAFAGGEVRFEVAGEKFERAFNGRAGHGNEVAKTFALVERENLAELFENRLSALTGLNFFNQRGQRIGFHPASRALAAGFCREKFRNF